MKTLAVPSRSRSIPSMRHIERAAALLPDPDAYRHDHCVIRLEETGMEVMFARYKFNSSREGKFYRWVYEGRFVV